MNSYGRVKNEGKPKQSVSIRRRCVPCWKTVYKVAAIKMYGIDTEIKQKVHRTRDPESTKHIERCVP